MSFLSLKRMSANTKEDIAILCNCCRKQTAPSTKCAQQVETELDHSPRLKLSSLQEIRGLRSNFYNSVKMKFQLNPDSGKLQNKQQDDFSEVQRQKPEWKKLCMTSLETHQENTMSGIFGSQFQQSNYTIS